MSARSGSIARSDFEFQGPYLGPIVLVFGLPAVCYGLIHACNGRGCIGWSSWHWPGLSEGAVLFSWQATAVYLAWLLLQAGLHLILPGQQADGVVLSNGRRLRYKLTGFRNALVTAALFSLGHFSGLVDFGWVYDNFVALLTAATVFSFIFSTSLYIFSHRSGRLLAAGGDTGYAVYDYFMGRELNPRIGCGFDLKQWCELTPGLIGWAVLDWSMAVRQAQQHGALSLPMLLVCCFQTLYVVDSVWFERAILTTMDITSDGFGFMLVFGDLVWVPFTYCLQARYLVDHSPDLSLAAAALITALQVVGFLTFRGSNSQKNTFRTHPQHSSVRHLKTLQTERGTKLIISGWWGIARHINYTGDWLMAWAWCLPCGFDSIIPYFYVIYFGVLLVHRELRDEHACKLKYGKDWDKYCSIVRHRLIPFLY